MTVSDDDDATDTRMATTHAGDGDSNEDEDGSHRDACDDNNGNGDNNHCEGGDQTNRGMGSAGTIQERRRRGMGSAGTIKDGGHRGGDGNPPTPQSGRACEKACNL